MRPPFFVYVRAKVGKNWVLEPGDTADKFYKVLGITVRNENELVDLAKKHLEKNDHGSILLGIDEIIPANISGAGLDGTDLCASPDKIGIWYFSGRAFFSDGDEDGIREWLDESFKPSPVN